MNLLNLLQNILYVLASAMLYPVMILLVVFFVWMIIAVGGLYRSIVRERNRLENKVQRNL